jgi:flagellar biosynthesis anti-sigma factor FlgM
MKINDPNTLGPGVTSTGVSKSGQTGRSVPVGGRPDAEHPTPNTDGDGVQLSGLAQGLTGLDAESPERQAQVEALAKAYADGTYAVDPDKTAAGIIDDALKHS